MNNNFFKFPSTPHLAVLGNVQFRDDKILSHDERNLFLNNTLTIEEKIDGANLGISFNDDGNICLQNRGSYLIYPYTGQWITLDKWLSKRIDSLFENLLNRYILFGEWCYACHSIFYNKLPDLFIGFDIYDKKINRFLSVEKRNNILKKIGIFHVPILAQGRFSFNQILSYMKQSHFSDEQSEGIYLRYDNKSYLIGRAKLVRPNFVQVIEKHWTKSKIQHNIVYNNNVY